MLYSLFYTFFNALVMGIVDGILVIPFLFHGEGVYDSFASSWSGSNFSLVTILYNGGISLKADREFAGFQPGEDLGPALRCAGIWSDYAFIDEHVTFDLEIPVRVVMYLGWLNDKLSNPAAPVPYKDEVLHCRFTTPFGLR